MAGAVGMGMIGCGGPGGGGGANPGALSGGEDPAEGGISEVPNPRAAMAAKSGKSLAQLQLGHEVYMRKCGECHAYQLPQHIEVAKWNAGKLKTDCGSDLGSAEVRAVVDYVSAVKTP